jgi:hypothetical protein
MVYQTDGKRIEILVMDLSSLTLQDGKRLICQRIEMVLPLETLKINKLRFVDGQAFFESRKILEQQRLNWPHHRLHRFV